MPPPHPIRGGHAPHGSVRDLLDGVAIPCRDPHDDRTDAGDLALHRPDQEAPQPVSGLGDGQSSDSNVPVAVAMFP